MEWDFSSLSNVGWIITTIVSIGILLVMIISLRKTKPKPLRKIIIRSKEPDSGIGLLLLGGILVYIIGRSFDEEDKEE